MEMTDKELDRFAEGVKWANSIMNVRFNAGNVFDAHLVFRPVEHGYILTQVINLAYYAEAI